MGSVPAKTRFSRSTHRRPVQDNGRRSQQADRQPRDAISEARRVATIERMTIQRMEHVRVVVGDLVAPRAFFVGDVAGSSA
jgi:hypothetical protein